MKIVWVDAMRSNVVELNDSETIAIYVMVTGSFLFWKNYLNQPLLVLGKAGLQPVTYCALHDYPSYSGLNEEDIVGAGVLCGGEVTSWYSSNYDVSTPEYWRNVITEALYGHALAVSA